MGDKHRLCQGIFITPTPTLPPQGGGRKRRAICQGTPERQHEATLAKLWRPTAPALIALRPAGAHPELGFDL
jgi:hypothetical protein